MMSPLVELAWPNKNAAPTLMTSPMKVSALGEIRVSASPYTMRSRSQPQARPKALVQVIQNLPCLLLRCAVPCFARGLRRRRLIMDGRQFQNFKLAFAVGR